MRLLATEWSHVPFLHNASFPVFQYLSGVAIRTVSLTAIPRFVTKVHVQRLASMPETKVSSVNL